MKSEPDEIHFNCPKCKRPMSGDKALLSEMINCPDCNEPFIPVPSKPEPEPETAKVECDTHLTLKSPSRLALYIFFGSIAIILGIALWKAKGPREKTWQEFSAEAEPLMLTKASNDIVGFRRTLHAYVDDHGDYKNPHFWTGEVEAEYINPVGGVSVTNVPYKFELYTENDGNIGLGCSYDWKKAVDEQFARDKAQYEAEMKAIENRR
jgi:hypothetical protein